MPFPYPLLKQHYRLVSQIGKGGFGTVYKAEDLQEKNKLVAVKELSQSGLSPQEFLEAGETLQREAYLLAGLSHPNLPHIYDHFKENGCWYLVMDFIEGETLEDRLTKSPGGRLPVEEVLQIGLQLSAALNYLHTHQPAIIFRDLKPSNIMWIPSGHVYLIDFGIARLFKSGQARDTIAFGSPGYAAPEQFGTTQTTPRSDIYSLGATLHQVLSGKDPSLNTPFLWDFAPLQVSAPNGLDALVMQMVKLRMDERPASIADVQVQLQRMSGDLTAQQKSPWADTPKAAAPARVFPFAPAQPPSPPRFQPERSRRKALGVYVLLSLLLLGMLVWGGNTLATALEHAQPHAAVSPDPKGTPPAPTATQTPTSVPRATPTDTPLPQPKQAVFVAPTSFGFSSSNCTPSSDGLDVQCVVTVGETADSQAPLSWSMSDSPGAGTFICSEDTSNGSGTLSPGQRETVTIGISCTPRCGIILHFSVQGPQNTAMTTYTSC